MVRRILLLLNRAAGVGQGSGLAGRLTRLLHLLVGQTTVCLQEVDAHDQAHARTRSFLGESSAPTAVLVGGGGGTLRAVLEAIAAENGAQPLPGPERLLVGALRLGSGNLLARHLRIPRQPEAALAALTASLRAGRSVAGCVVACEVDERATPGHPQPRRRRLHGVGLVGLGQFGGTPRDLAGFQRRWPHLRRLGARLLGLERYNHLAYGLALGRRSWLSALSPARLEEVEIRWPGGCQRLRLLAGALLNFPVPALPLEPGVRLEDPAFSLHLLPYRGRWQALALVLFPRQALRHALHVRIEAPQEVEIRLLDRDTAEFFLDEDPEVFGPRLTFRVAGTLAFLPGPAYTTG